MKLVVILNINPDRKCTTKITDSREFTLPELKISLQENLSDLTDHIVYYDNFGEFRKNATDHLNDFVINFDFGYNKRFRNMNVPAFCENYGISYFNPDPYVQILCQDKYLTKKFAENFGIKTPQSTLVFSHTYNRKLLNRFSYPIIIKPNYESESIGISQKSIASDIDQADLIVHQLLSDFSGVLIEEYIEGNEVAITIFDNNNALFLEEIEFVFPNLPEIRYKAYTSEIKQHMTIEMKKSNYLSKHETECIKQMYYSLSPNKLIRIDGRIRDSEFYLIEINANPGLYPKSVVPKTFEINGYTYKEMLKMLVLPLRH